MNWTEQEYAEYMRTHGFHAGLAAADVSAPPFKLPANEPGAYALGCLPVSKMNKLESAYDAHLWQLRHQGEIIWHKYEGIKLKLADNTFYTPDFFVVTKDRELECRETKGFMRDDAAVKIKVAASLYPFRFRLVRKAKGGLWDITEMSR